jgi:hypothetical protein
VPEHVAEREQPPPVVARQHPAVAVEVGDVVDLHRQPPLRALRDVAGRHLELAEMPAEGDLLRVVDPLVAEDEDAVAVHAVFDRRGLRRRDAARDVHAGDLAHEAGARRICRTDGDRHAAAPP